MPELRASDAERRGEILLALRSAAAGPGRIDSESGDRELLVEAFGPLILLGWLFRAYPRTMLTIVASIIIVYIIIVALGH